MHTILKILCVISILIVLSFYIFYSYANNNIRFLYVSNLNLYPTPITTIHEKCYLEKKYGFLIYESQSIFQEIIRYINKNVNFDLVVFGGNSISHDSKEKAKLKEDFWQLFLDMASEIKSQILLVLGENEIKTKNTYELVNALNIQGIKTNTTWWSYNLKDFLFVGVNSFYFLSKHVFAKDELNWLKYLFSKNKEKFTIIFLDEPLLNLDFKEFDNQLIQEFYKIINSNPQIKLVISSSKNLNRIKLINKKVHVVSSSLISFPCSFKVIEISPQKIKIKTYPIPLKGIIKKAEQSLIDSEIAQELFPASLKSIKKHVLGLPLDTNFEVNLSNL